jgi:hypothetical protein
LTKIKVINFKYLRALRYHRQFKGKDKMYDRLKDRLKEAAKNNILIAGAGLVAGYFLLTAAVYGASLPPQAAIETLQNRDHHGYTARLDRKYQLALMQTKGFIECAEFTRKNGEKMSACDTARILEGKMFNNMVMGEMEEGKRYHIHAIGAADNLGLLEAKLVQ